MKDLEERSRVQIHSEEGVMGLLHEDTSRLRYQDMGVEDIQEDILEVIKTRILLRDEVDTILLSSMTLILLDLDIRLSQRKILIKVICTLINVNSHKWITTTLMMICQKLDKVSNF